MATFYIANDGSNGNTGLDPTVPWQTIGRVNIAMGIHTFLFKCGDTFDDTSLVVNAVCTIGSYGSGNLPIFSGVADDRVCIYVDGDITGATIENLELRTGITPGLYCLNVRTGVVNDLVVQDMIFSAGEYGFRSEAASSGTGNIIRRCTFGPDDGAIWEDGVSNNGDFHCECYSNVLSGIGVGNTGSSSSGDPFSAHETCTINAHHNRCLGNKRGGYFHVNTTGTNIFRNNFVTWNDDGGLFIGRQDSGGTCNTYNNVFIVEGTAAVTVLSNAAVTAGTSTSRFWNNTVICRNANTNTFLYSNARDSGAGTPTMHVKNCIAFMNNATSRQIKSNPANTVYVGDNNSYSHTTAGRFVTDVGVDFTDWKTAWAGQDLASITGDPGLLNSAGSSASSARLASDSDCIDAGQDLSVSFTVDYADRTRVLPFDIGAFEFFATGGGAGGNSWWG